jgi:C4-dicarboxylate transporter DctM subunit
VARLTVYDLSVIPLFLLMGQFATQGGLSARCSRPRQPSSAMRGGLGMAAVLAAGSLRRGLRVVGGHLGHDHPGGLPRDEGARLPRAACPPARWPAGGTLGILIPPSVPLVVYAILTEQNIAKLFAAAMLPGLLAMLGYIAVIALSAGGAPTWRRPRCRCPGRSAGRRCWPSGRSSLIFAVVFGGIYGGVFSPTEGAAVGAVATLVAGLAQRELGWRGIRAASSAPPRRARWCS